MTLKQIYTAFGTNNSVEEEAKDAQTVPVDDVPVELDNFSEPEKPSENIGLGIKDLKKKLLTPIHYQIIPSEKLTVKPTFIQRLKGKQKSLEGVSCGLFSETNKFRRACSAICQNTVFDSVVILLIILSSVMLTFESPLADPKSGLAKIFESADLAFTVIFILEAAIKIITFGFAMNGKNSYLRNKWNILDFLIVTVSILNLTLSATGNLSSVRVIRVLRILRPIRIVARN